MKTDTKTSWEKEHNWYQKIVGNKGHFYHENVIFPNLINLLNLNKDSNILDLGAGQGILSRKIPGFVSYTGIDISKSMIELAKKQNKNPKHLFITADATRTLPTKLTSFTHAVFILSLQNMENIEEAIANASKALINSGKLIIVLNHPCFRIPRQSGWGINPNNNLQYRYINLYLSQIKIPILMHPGENNSQITWSFHKPLNAYTNILFNNGFLIEKLEEWTGSKESAGKFAKMENKARAEIPLFLTIVARRLSFRAERSAVEESTTRNNSIKQISPLASARSG